MATIDDGLRDERAGRNCDERIDGLCNEYRSELAHVSLTSDEKDRMAARMAAARRAAPAAGAREADVLELRSNASSRAARRPRHRLAIAAAAAVLALAVGLGGYAYASGQLASVADLVQAAFGAAPADTEVVGKVGRPVNASVSHDGVTVSADAVMGDDYSYVVIYSISRDDGRPLADLAEGAGATPGDYTMPLTDGRWLVPKAVQNVSGSSAEGGAQWLYDADPTDNALQLVIAYGTDTNVIGRTVHMTFRGLQAWSETDGAWEDLLGGSWDLSFKLNYESDAVTMGAGQRITLPQTHTAATVEQVSVSSVGVTVDYVAEGKDAPGPEQDGYDDTPTRLGLGDITVTLRDGTQIVADGAGGTSRGDAGDDTACRITTFLDRVIDPADVASVSFCGVTMTPA